MSDGTEEEATDHDEDPKENGFDPRDFYGENHIMSILAVLVFALAVILLTIGLSSGR